MKKTIIGFLLIILMVTGGGWTINTTYNHNQVQAAQENNLDLILAQASVKGLLNSLRYSTANRSNIVTFYLTEQALASEVATELMNLQITDYEIISTEQLDDNTYQITAELIPNNGLLVADVSKVGVRRRIINLAWGTASSNSTSTDVSTDTTTTDTSTIPTNAPTLEVLSYKLNVRSGPGINYPPLLALDQGDKVKIVGKSGLGTWYQIARNGQIIGWTSSWSNVVSVSPNADDVPVVMAPAPSTNTATNTNVGKMILQTHSGGDFYLYDGSTLRYIASGIDPAFSPDGTKIAFTRWGGGEIGSLWIYDLTNDKEWSILGNTKQAKSPTWSPDGSQIIINFQEGGRLGIESNCYNPRSDGSYPALPHRAYDISVKSDGRICFKLPVDTFWQLRQVTIANGAFKDLPSQAYSYAPTWDPANDWRVVFASSTGLLQLDLNRNEYFPFSTDLRDRGPVFSPDGQFVAVTYKQHRHWDIYTINTATSQRTRLTSTSVLADRQVNNAAPAWSPDSQQIAFVTDRNGEWEFWIMNADGSNAKPLLSDNLATQISVEYNGVDERLISWGK